LSEVAAALKSGGVESQASTESGLGSRFASIVSDQTFSDACVTVHVRIATVAELTVFQSSFLHLLKIVWPDVG
jgi:hypothetical protein